MAHTHSADTPAGPDGLGRRTTTRHRRALRILVVILIPLAIWTVAGLIALWPGDISGHVNREVVNYSVPGVTYPKARITAIKQISCEACRHLRADTHCQPHRGAPEGDDKARR